MSYYTPYYRLFLDREIPPQSLDFQCNTQQYLPVKAIKKDSEIMHILYMNIY